MKHKLNRPRVEKELQPTYETPEGTKVKVHKDNGEILETVTRSRVFILGGHSLMVQVEGIAGCYAVDCIEIVKERPTKSGVQGKWYDVGFRMNEGI